MSEIPPPPPEVPQPTRFAATSWRYIESILTERHPPLLADLRPGASDTDLDRAQAQLGILFPESFRAFYKGHDGQTGAAPGLFFGMKFLSLEEIVQYHAFWQELLASDPETYGKAGDSLSIPPETIDTRYIHAQWMPFAASNGNHLGLDFAPGSKGTIGQCITFGRDQRKKFLVGRSFDEFMAWVQPRFDVGGSSFQTPTGFPPDVIEFSLLPPAAPEMIGLLKLLYEN